MNPDDAPRHATTESPAVKAQRRFGVWHQLRTVCRMHPRRLGALLVQAFSDWSTDGAARLGAALAYYTLFSVAPVLIVITGVAGVFVGQAAARAEIVPWLQRFLSPEGARAAELMLQQHVTPTGGLVTSAIGFLTLFVTTSAFVNELRQSLNQVWRVQTPSSESGVLGAMRTILTDRLYGFLIAVGAAVLILLSLAVNATIAIAGSYFEGSLPLPASLLHLFNFLVSFVVLTAVFTLLYKVVPDAYVAWGDAGVGALVTAVLFDLGTLLLSMFVGQAAGSPYGTAAGVLALLTWVYYSAQVFFFGAELTRIFATTHGGGIVPVHRSIRAPRWQHSMRRGVRLAPESPTGYQHPGRQGPA